MAFRFRETEERPRALKAIRESVVGFMSAATSGDDKYSHLSEADLQSVIEKCANTQKWLDDMGAKQAEKRKDEKPAFTSTEVNKRREEVEYFCRPILNKAKPKPKADATKKEEGKAPETNGAKDGDEEMPELETADEEATKPDMDVD